MTMEPATIPPPGAEYKDEEDTPLITSPEEEATISRAKEVFSTVRGALSLAGVVIATVGQIILFAEDTYWSNALEQGQSREPFYFFLFTVIAYANLISIYRDEPKWIWVSSTLAFLLLDVNVCQTNTIFRYTRTLDLLEFGSNDERALKAGAVMLMTGSLLSFAAFPFSLGFSERFVTPFRKGCLAFGMLITVLLLVGSVLLWSRKDPCEINDSTNRSEMRYPIFVGRAAYIAVWYAVSVVFGFTEGIQLAYLLAAVTISDYQPFGPRCHWDECKAGTSLIFTGLVLLVMFHSLIEVIMVPTKVDTRRLRTPTGILVSLGALLGLAGAVITWSTTDEIYFQQFGLMDNKHVTPQEAFDITLTLVGVVLLLVSFLTRNAFLPVLAMALQFSVMNRMVAVCKSSCGNSSEPGTCPWAWWEPSGFVQHMAAGVRTGYFLLFVGSIMSYLALPKKASTSDEDYITGLVMCIILFSCVCYLGQTSQYYGQLGFTALLHMWCSYCQYSSGLNFIYLTALLQAPFMTPYSTCESGAASLAVLMSLMVLVFLIIKHILKHGMASRESPLSTMARDPAMDMFFLQYEKINATRQAARE